MKPFEAQAYVEGWDACLQGRSSQDNPYWPKHGEGHAAWGRRREQAWHDGWTTCRSGAAFIDPRKKPLGVAHIPMGEGR